MTINGFALLAIILLIFPMLYFLLASPTFLLRPLSDPVVTRLLRGLVNVHFCAVTVTCGIAILAFLLAGRPGVAIGIGVLAALAIGARRWFLARMDAELRFRDSGDATAVPRLRRLHWAGMLYNAVQFTLVVGSVSWIFPPGA
ncbi:hypothetical protein ACVFYP_19315 [Roseomonas sp. F4]